MDVAYDLLPRPDWAATTTVVVDDPGRHDAAGWARAVFSAAAVPLWGKALFGVREVAVRLLRIPRGEPSMLAVKEVRDGVAVIDTDDVHLRFVATVWTEGHLLHVTTAVRFKGVRGRVYFVPVRFLHDVLTRSMAQRAVARG